LDQGRYKKRLAGEDERRMKGANLRSQISDLEAVASNTIYDSNEECLFQWDVNYEV
jgi:hypothetical protein